MSLPNLYYSALISLYPSLSFTVPNSEFLLTPTATLLLILKHVYLSIYIIRIAQLQGNHGYSLLHSYNKQDEMKLENI